MGRPRLQGDCTIPGCGGQAKARGWCKAHYERWKATGDVTSPTLTEIRRQDADEVLWLLSCGVGVEEALTRVGWTPGAAYRWALRHTHDRLKAAVADAAGHERRKATA